MRQSKGAAAIIATVIALAVLALLFVFFWKVAVYYRAIKSGDTSKLPQFSSQSTPTPDIAEVRSSGSVDRISLETVDDPWVGSEEARLVIVEFVDYECPFCQQAAGTVRSLATKYGDQARFIIRDFPVSELHSNAFFVAEAVGCAEEQGKYWQMHDRVFSHAGGFSAEALNTLAAKSGLDIRKYQACMSGRVRQAEIEEDLFAGQSAGVRGTPTFFFNGHRVEGLIPEKVFEDLINDFLDT